LTKLGASGDNAEAIADTITAAERDDCKSHGLFRLPGYCAGLRNGRIDGRAVPAVHDLAPAVVQVDAKGGFAPLALRVGRPALIEKARFSDEERRRIEAVATRLVEAARAGRHKGGGVDSFLAEYGLSSEEGVLLLCLAEALLRIPDAATADRLIAGERA